jgi:uncharacterized protein (DUF58 family)
MIVPRPRLLLWVGLLAVPAAALSAIGSRAAIAAAVATGVLTVVVLVDAFLAARPLQDLALEFPATVRTTLDREGTIELRLRNPTGRGRRIRVGLAFPAEIDSPDPERPVDLPAGAPLVSLAWSCLPRRRGCFVLAGGVVECGSPLDFWGARRRAGGATEIRVYPSPLRERAGVAAVLMRRPLAGMRPRRQVGKGREFEKLREYVPGDSPEDIHWKATARRGRPITRVYQVERTQEVYLAIDGSRLSARPAGEPPTPALERFVSAALVLALATGQQGDLFGLLAFSDRVRRFVRAGRGRSHYDACREMLLGLQPDAAAPDFEDFASFVRLRLRRRALLIVLTDLGDPVLSEEFVRALDLVRRQHLVVVGMLRPDHARPLFTGPLPAGTPEIYARLGGHLVWQGLRELGRTLQLRGSGLALVGHENLSAEIVSRYLAVKQRQLL